MRGQARPAPCILRSRLKQDCNRCGETLVFGIGNFLIIGFHGM